MSLLTAAGYLLWIFHRDYVTDSAWTVLRDIHFRPILSGILAASVVLGVHSFSPALTGLSDVRYFVPIKIFIDLTIFFPIYVVLLIALGQVTTIDRNNFMGLLNFGIGFIRHPFRERVKIYR